jgi:UDP-N-acetylglucosamine 2-epimerase
VLADKVLVIVGTRPEVIKMAPVVQAMRDRPESFRVELCVVGQQTAILDGALAEWGLEPEVRLDPAGRCRGPSARLAAMLGPLEAAMQASGPRWVLVHGDTTTTLAGALAATYSGREVVHVEAGLRSGDPRCPFPEEMHRTLVDRMAAVLYAPTRTARDHLIRDGCDPERIVVVGNTVVDAIEAVCRRPSRAAPARWGGRRMILVTGHRRESFGSGLVGVCRAIRRLVLERDDIQVVYVLHPHPEAHRPTQRLLSGVGRVELLPPLGYREFVTLMRQAYLIVTDSGGIQEEAPYLGKPVLVTRERTERPEAVEEGVARMVGLRPEAIARSVRQLLDDREAHAAMARRVHPFGRPGASRRICEDLARRLRRSRAS